MVSPLGNNVSASWKNILAGKSGMTKITHFDPEGYATQIAAEVKDFDVSEFMPAKEARRIDTFIQYALAATHEAMEDANLTDTDKNRVGVAVGSGIGGIQTIENNVNLISKSGPKKVSPFFIPGTVINMAAGSVAIKYGFTGPNIAITTACTTGTHNIGYAARTIAYGDADVMVAGGSEMAITQLGVAGFAAARAMTTRNDEPEKASRPWDEDRDGFVLGEGAGILILEEYEHAKKRGAKIYAELAGFGMSDDAHHITSPPEDGAGARVAMENAIADAGIEKNTVNYINAHGTSTPLGDIAETNAVKDLFDQHAYDLVVSSTKSMTGHLLGAAGAIEAIFSVLAIRDNVAPPTINLENPSEGCDLDYAANQAKEMQVDVSISNSFGFGGTNGSLLFKRVV